LRLVSDDPGAAGEQQGDLVSRLRAVIGAKDEQIAVLAAGLEASLERERRLELRVAELERRLSMDSTDSGTPSSKERIGANEARRARQQSEQERSKDRKRGGQPGHEGKGLKRDPDPAGPATSLRVISRRWPWRSDQVSSTGRSLFMWFQADAMSRGLAGS
jgi:hypothetical protein